MKPIQNVTAHNLAMMRLDVDEAEKHMNKMAKNADDYGWFDKAKGLCVWAYKACDYIGTDWLVDKGLPFGAARPIAGFAMICVAATIGLTVAAIVVVPIMMLMSFFFNPYKIEDD